MTNLPSTPSGSVVFCDDIRQEVGGKVSFIGVYGGDMILNAPLPASVLSLCLAISYVERLGESSEPVELRIYFPGDDKDKPTRRARIPIEQMREEATAASIAKGTLLVARVMARISPALIRQEGDISAHAYRGDDEVELGALEVTVREAQAKPASDEKPSSKQ